MRRLRRCSRVWDRANRKQPRSLRRPFRLLQKVRDLRERKRIKGLNNRTLNSFMIGVATVLYAIARVLQFGADVCCLVASVCERNRGNPGVPEEPIVVIALWILGFRKTVIVWILVLWAHGDATVSYVLNQSGNFTAVLSQ